MLTPIKKLAKITTNSRLNMIADHFYSRNLLYQTAANLIAIITQLKRSLLTGSAVTLRQSLMNEVITFEARALQYNLSQETVDAARYALCALIDEIILNQQLGDKAEWKTEEDWSQHCLINIFYHETWGGEKFFTLLEQFMHEPEKYIELLEIFALCLTLGFEGKYRIKMHGADHLALLREKLILVIKKFRNDIPPIFAMASPVSPPVSIDQYDGLFALLILLFLFFVLANFWALGNKSLTQALTPFTYQENSHV